LVPMTRTRSQAKLSRFPAGISSVSAGWYWAGCLLAARYFLILAGYLGRYSPFDTSEHHEFQVRLPINLDPGRARSGECLALKSPRAVTFGLPVTREQRGSVELVRSSISALAIYHSFTPGEKGHDRAGALQYP
jgi:hypothetical protein